MSIQYSPEQGFILSTNEGYVSSMNPVELTLEREQALRFSLEEAYHVQRTLRDIMQVMVTPY